MGEALMVVVWLFWPVLVALAVAYYFLGNAIARDKALLAWIEEQEKINRETAGWIRRVEGAFLIDTRPTTAAEEA